MKKLICSSIILFSLFGVSAYANVIKIGSGDDFSVSINGGLPAAINITETAGYFGFNGQAPQNFDNPTSLQGNAPNLVAISGDVADFKKSGITSVQAAITKMTTDKYGQLKAVNCLINTPVQPENLNLFVTYDASINAYVCK